MTRHFVPAALAALMFAVSGAAPAFAEEAAKPALGTAPPAISVVEAKVLPVSESVTVTGTLVPREEIQVAADVDGLKIERLLVDAGDTVTAGQVLARLAVDQIDIQLAQNTSELARADAAIARQESAIAEAKATADEAVAALQRTQTLKDKGVVAQDVLDERISAASTARARLANAEHGLAFVQAERNLTEAQRAELELRKTKTELKAPAAGLVLERTARIGQVVSAQTGPLFRIAEDGLVELDAEVIETDLARIDVGQKVAIAAAGGVKIDGTVRLVSPEVNAATRLGHVRVALADGAKVRVGAFARGTVEVARREGVTVPVSAVVTSGDTATVQVVKDNKVETRTVKVGLSQGDVIEIVEGLTAGDTVVARAGTFLRDGDTITPVAAPAEEAKG